MGNAKGLREGFAVEEVGRRTYNRDTQGAFKESLMAIDRIPLDLIPSGGSHAFTQDTIPEALKKEHQLAAGHWGVLHVFEGSLKFIDIASGEERTIKAPDLVTIHPEAPHRVSTDEAVSCRLDFFREQGTGESEDAGGFVDEDVKRSFDRCEENGNFAETFYGIFLNASPEIAPYFSATDFERQRKVLRQSVHMMIANDVTNPAMRDMMNNLGRIHGRAWRDIHPRLYELWLDSICQAASKLDPEWSDELEREWRVRLRPGMQLIMAAY